MAAASAFSRPCRKPADIAAGRRLGWRSGICISMNVGPRLKSGRAILRTIEERRVKRKCESRGAPDALAWSGDCGQPNSRSSGRPVGQVDRCHASRAAATCAARSVPSVTRASRSWARATLSIFWTPSVQRQCLAEPIARLAIVTDGAVQRRQDPEHSSHRRRCRRPGGRAAAPARYAARAASCSERASAMSPRLLMQLASPSTSPTWR